jgi:uncharacterized membrane protein (DUF485 family)
MTDIDEQKNLKPERRNFFEVLTEIFGWFQIVISFLLIGGMIGFLIYALSPNTLTLTIGITIAAAGLIFGIIYATKKWKGKGTVDLVSRVSATPELDDLE